MPYIKQIERPEIDVLLNKLVYIPAFFTKGGLNYTVCRLLRLWVGQNKCYEAMSDAKSAVVDAAGEYQRRVIDPYENEKLEKNGDVF